MQQPSVCWAARVGMTRIFTDDGTSVPVTVIEVGNNRVTQVKTTDTDGYNAVQLTFGERRASRISKAVAGHLAKAGSQGGTQMGEFHVDAAKLNELPAGSVIAVDSVFVAGQKS